MDYLYNELQTDFYVIVCEYNGHYENSIFTTRQNEAGEITRYLLKENIKSVKMIYGQSMGAEVGIELWHQLTEKDVAEKAFFDGVPCIKLSKTYKAFMNMKFKKFIHIMKNKKTEDVLQWKFLNALTNGDTESLRPLIEGCINVTPYLTDESIKVKTECCYIFDFPLFGVEEQKKMFFFYAKEEKAYKTCYKGLKQAYPNAKFKAVVGYGHITYSMKHTSEYIHMIRDMCV